MNGRSLSPMALDIGAEVVRAVQLRPGTARERLSAWARVPRVSESWTAEEAFRVCSSLRRQGFEGRDVVLVMPAAEAPACLLEFRGRSAQAVDEVAMRSELSRMHRLEPGAFEYGAWKAPGSGRARGTETWLAVCTPHERAETLVGPLEEQGLRVLGIDAGCFAIARAARSSFTLSSLGVVVHLARECARFVAMVDEQVVYERVLSALGWRRVFERASAQSGLTNVVVRELFRAMSVPQPHAAGIGAGIARLRPLVDDHMRALAQELRQSLAYLESGYSNLPLHGVVLMGEGSAIGGWTTTVQATTGARTRVLGARDLVDGADAVDDESGADLTLAIGLARYAAVEEVVP